MKNSFALPVFPVGTGLGNRLFHWCDAKIYCYHTGCQFISPRWCRVALGKYLRSLAKGQVISDSLLEYANIFRRLPGDISYQRGIALSLFLSKLQLSKNSEALPNSMRPYSVLYFDKSNYTFHGYGKYRSSLTKDIIASIRPHILDKVLNPSEPFIGIHVRIGDGFKPPEPGTDGFVRTGWLQQTPIQWFKETLRFIRKATGVNYPVYIFSDGPSTRLKSLLEESNTFIYKSNSPAADLLSLSRSWLILGSGSSSFSAFAAFLGSAHALTAPGHPFAKRGLKSNSHQLVSCFNPLDITERDRIKSLLT
jgi:hypothetical protein